jgi:arabinoxylan arabinofuranohydrolase
MLSKSIIKVCLAATCGMAISAMADNPVSSYHYLADPSAAADDENFYIITDSDDPAPYNATGYSIKSLYAFSSKDMKNWTDYGIIYQAKREASYVSDIWASGVGVKKGTFYIIFPNGASGVGLIKSSSVNGPYTNAVSGHNMLVGGGGVVDCDGVAWCFDPGIFFDDDGTGWITFGGGESSTRPNTNNFDIYQLNSDVNSVVTSTKTRVEVQSLPTRKMLEASYIHKHNGNYYFSYSTGWQSGAPSIDYGMSTKPTGPYTWKGTILDDPAINGKSINGNNNHAGVAEFKGHSYVVYHDRRIANGYNGLEVIPASDGQPNPNGAYHRSVGIDEMFYNTDGTIKKVVVTNDGPEQIANFDPYATYPALTSSKQKGIRSRTDYTAGQPVTHVLTPLATRTDSWIRVSGVDFGTAATKFIVDAASVADGNKIEIRTGSATGTLAGTCTLKNTGSWSTYADNECTMDGLSGIVDQLFIVFKGSKDSTMGIRSWSFDGSGSTPATPQTAYNGDTVTIPSVIQAELFDVSGTRDKAYSDNDAENQGDAKFRTDEGVDIVLGGTGKAVGYTNAGEWMEYTVKVPTSGNYAIKAGAATGSDSTSFCLQIDGKLIGDTIKVTKTGEDWSTYKVFDGGTASLTAGTHQIRLLLIGAYVNIDWFAIGDVKLPDTGTTKIGAELRLNSADNETYRVFNLNGKLLGNVSLNGNAASKALKLAGYKDGVYMLRSANGKKTFMTSSAK